MARRIGRWNPSDAANTFVRMVLSEVGEIVGGLTDEQWTYTREYFRGRCAYTGCRLSDAEVVQEHAVPINREHCGVHAFGNVLPASEATNDEKAGRHYRDYMAETVRDKERLEMIERFVAESGYAEHIAPFGDLGRYCEQQYRTVVALAEVNRAHLRGFVEGEEIEVLQGDEDGDGTLRRSRSHRRRETLPIQLEPAGRAFQERLVAGGEAWLTTYYDDGREEVQRWDASRMSPTSNVIANLRSRPNHRNPRWKDLGITRVRVTIDPVFQLTLERSYYADGFFNVPVAFDCYVGECGSVELVLGRGEPVRGRIDRGANRNGTARVFGGARLRTWFQRHHAQGGRVLVRIRSRNRVDLA